MKYFKVNLPRFIPSIFQVIDENLEPEANVTGIIVGEGDIGVEEESKASTELVDLSEQSSLNSVEVQRFQGQIHLLRQKSRRHHPH